MLDAVLSLQSVLVVNDDGDVKCRCSVPTISVDLFERFCSNAAD